MTKTNQNLNIKINSMLFFGLSESKEYQITDYEVSLGNLQILEVQIGIGNPYGEELFTFTVYSKKYWEDGILNNHPPFKGYVVFNILNLQNITDYTKDTIDSVLPNSENYKEFAKNLSKTWYWEFEDYKQ